MTADVYGEAFYQAVANGTSVSDALSRLSAILKERGHSALYRDALRVAEAHFSADVRKETLTVTLAKTKDRAQFKDAIEAFGKEAGTQSVVVKEDDSIIGGYILQGGGVELDKSYKSALLSVYRALTA